MSGCANEKLRVINKGSRKEKNGKFLAAKKGNPKKVPPHIKCSKKGQLKGAFSQSKWLLTVLF